MSVHSTAFLIPLGLIFGSLATLSAELPSEATHHIHHRSPYQNSRLRFELAKEGHVAFLGGSITQNTKGHTAMVPAWLKDRFPETKFTFTNAGISSTCSTTGAFRVKPHVLDQGPVDLFIVEFAVNDDQDATHARREALRGMEGIIRQVRRHNPHSDIIIVHFSNPEIYEAHKKGETPISVDAHEAVAKHYNIASVNVGGALAAGAMTWETYGGTHPKQPGYRLVSDMILSVLEKAWSEDLPADAKKAEHRIPKPIDSQSYAYGTFLNPNRTDWMGGWETGQVSKELLPNGSIRGNFLEEEITVASEEGAMMTVNFQGRAIGAYVLAGPDAALLEVSMDGGPFKKVDLYHRFSQNLNYPRTVMFFTDLEYGFHQLTLRVGKRIVGFDQHGGNRAAILNLVVNE